MDKNIDWPNKNANPKAVAHAAVGNADKLKQSGKDVGLVDPPIQSLHPTSGGQGDVEEKPAKDFKIVTQPHLNFRHGPDYIEYDEPFADLQDDEAFFVPVPEGGTTDKLMFDLNKKVSGYIKQTSEIELDENGDEIFEVVVIKTKKRNDDGTIQLDGEGKPIVGANQTTRPKYINACNFIVKAVVKGDEIADGEEADSDGALVIRVM